jgi:hypothetical protein
VVGGRDLSEKQDASEVGTFCAGAVVMDCVASFEGVLLAAQRSLAPSAFLATGRLKVSLVNPKVGALGDADQCNYGA